MVKLQGRENYPIYFGASSEMLRIAGELRKEMTQAEKILWEQLRNKQLLGFRFRRQHPIGEIVVDFFCYEALLVVEVDGDVHNTPYQKERDRERSNILKSFGIKEVRFRNEEIMNDLQNVLTKIKEALNRK
ncbi:MAG: endonuclease domain-containing protein [Bacteroidales bacterium]|nr:endonuclease domain-containing protein [Lentimicrobiaceae bacterium]MDD5696231.1 endonuclease domain-containing protein [Bacteroidales bacterium]